ncbi:hypothetical protein ACFX13_000346 [Malus domestica]
MWFLQLRWRINTPFNAQLPILHLYLAVYSVEAPSHWIPNLFNGRLEMFLASSLSTMNFKLILMIWWAIRFARNNLLWNGKIESPDLVAARAISFWLEFMGSSSPVPLLITTPSLV